MHVLEELALCRGGISDDAHVDVPAELDALRRLLVDAAQEHQENAALHLAEPHSIAQHIEYQHPTAQPRAAQHQRAEWSITVVSIGSAGSGIIGVGSVGGMSKRGTRAVKKQR